MRRDMRREDKKVQRLEKFLSQNPKISQELLFKYSEPYKLYDTYKKIMKGE